MAHNPFGHIDLRVNDRESAKAFYGTLLPELGFTEFERGKDFDCFYAGGETFGPGKRVISSTNRNFEGRQGPGTRTHLASPLTVAASACAGTICEASELSTTRLAASVGSAV